MKNAVFGKTMENVKNRMDLHLTTSHENAVKWFNKINFKHVQSYDGLYLIETYKKQLVYDKPTYVCRYFNSRSFEAVHDGISLKCN